MDVKGIKPFLHNYLSAIANGDNLALPRSIKYPDVRKTWYEILTELGKSFDEEVLETLAKYWIHIVTKQGAKIHKNFVEECLKIINYQAENKDNIQTQISDAYYEKVKIKPLSKNPRVLKEKISIAVKQNQVLNFLILYLSLSRFNKKVQVPLSSLYEPALRKWQLIFKTELNLKVEADFLDALTNQWVTITQDTGIPASVDLQKTLYEKLLPKYTSSNKAQKTIKTPKTLWDKLFG